MSFQFFSELPAELRLKVWELALPGPRTIQVHHRYEFEYLNRSFPTPKPKDNEILYALYDTCVDSCETVKRHYDQLFGHNIKRLQRPIWIDPSVDTLRIPSRVTICEFFDDVIEGRAGVQGLGPVRHLAIISPLEKRHSRGDRISFFGPWAIIVYTILYRDPKTVTFEYDWGPELGRERSSELVQMLRNHYQSRGPRSRGIRERWNPEPLNKFKWTIAHDSVFGNIQDMPQLFSQG